MPDPEARAVLVRISGRVQGVGFRAWTVEEARRRDLSGWVRNTPNGDVEALFSGPAATVDAMVELCRRGPQSAHVDRVSVEVSPPVQGPFKVRYGI
jgi:acylphosphatase